MTEDPPTPKATAWQAEDGGRRAEVAPVKNRTTEAFNGVRGWKT